MTKAELLANLSGRTNILAVGTPEVTQPQDDLGITWYIVNVFETGASKTGVPIGQRKNVSFYVYMEGTAQEEALFMLDEPQTELDRIVRTNSDSLEAIYSIYSADFMRTRVSGALIQVSHGIFGEDPLTPSHDRRVKLAVDIKLDCMKYTPLFSQLAAMEAGVRSNAEDTLDSVFINLVTVYFTPVADILFPDLVA